MNEGHIEDVPNDVSGHKSFPPTCPMLSTHDATILMKTWLGSTNFSRLAPSPITQQLHYNVITTWANKILPILPASPKYFHTPAAFFHACCDAHAVRHRLNVTAEGKEKRLQRYYAFISISSVRSAHANKRRRSIWRISPHASIITPLSYLMPGLVNKLFKWSALSTITLRRARL